jgi:hypothetical protein
MNCLIPQSQSRKVLHSRLPLHTLSAREILLIFEPDVKPLRHARHSWATTGTEYKEGETCITHVLESPGHASISGECYDPFVR